MFRAEVGGLRQRGSNPRLGTAKNPRSHVALFLDANELARLGSDLDAREAESPEAVAAIRLLARTGCRCSEVLNPPERCSSGARRGRSGRRGTG